jgi:uncharacterized protein YndB with AHSA1/START domain
VDGDRFDKITRSLASGASRRRVLKGLAGGIAAGFAAAVGRREQAEAQVAPAQCGNVPCAGNPGACGDGCVCCVFRNGNSRCMSPSSCSGTPTCGPGEIFDPTLGCVPAGTGGSCFSQADCDPGFACVFFGQIGICSPTSPTGTAFTASPETLWQALTDAETLSSLGIDSDIAPQVGHRFQFRAAAGVESQGTIEAEMISVDAPRQFAFKWLNGPLDEPTTVTVNLDSEENGAVTRLRLAHTDQTGASCRAGALVLGRNWGQRILKEALPRYLGQEPPAL